MDDTKQFLKQINQIGCLAWLAKWMFIACGFMVLGAVVACLFGQVEFQKSQSGIIEPNEPADFLIGPVELQELLNKIEPDNPIKVDGLIGTETITKWSRVYCNQSAKRTFTKDK